MAESGTVRVAVLASGSGSNFQALLDHFPAGAEAGSLRGPRAAGHGSADAVARVALLLASREGIGAAERARRSGVPVVVLPEAVRTGGPDGEARFLIETLREHRTELVVLAGWLRLVPSEVVAAFRSCMLNIHPALLPAFGGKGMYGRYVHRAVLASGARVSGPTVHLVDEEYDRGTILAQWPVPVREEDDEERLAARVLEAEHRLLPAVVEALARHWAASGTRDGSRLPLPWLRGERFLIEGAHGTSWLPGEEPVPSGARGARPPGLERDDETRDERGSE